MLKQIMDYLKTNRRSIRKNIRSNYTRPIKDDLHYRIILLKITYHNVMNNLLQLKNLKSIGFAIILFWLLRDFAFAADNVTNGINTAIEGLNGVMSVITFIVHPLVMFVGWLLSPDWTYGDIIGLRPVLYKMWTLVSNVVYVIFAFLLIAIAFLNVFKENTNMSIKNTLPRLIVGILIVPFTWLIVSLTLSVSNVLTASVISLPMDTISAINPATSDGKSILSQITIPSQIIIDITESNAGSKVSTGGTQLSLESFLGSQKGAYNLLPFYAYGIFKIDKIKNIGTNQTGEAIKQIGDVFKKLTFGTIFALIFTILVIALAFALFSRMGMLWLYAMFSPLFALSYFFSGSVKGGKFSEDIKKHFSIEKFISLAMVPVYVAAALSFGLMFLATAINFKGSTTSQIELTKVTGGQQDMKFGGFTLSIKGNYQDEDGIASGLMNTTKGLISNIIISFIALMILWMAVMAALNANEITKSAVQPFEQMGKSVGGLIKDSPKYVPIPGLSGSLKGQSVSSMSQGVTQAISAATSQHASTQATKFAEILRGKDEGLKLTGMSDEVVKILNATPNNPNMAFDKFKEAMLQAKTPEQLAANEYFRNASSLMAKSLNMSDDELKKYDLKSAEGMSKLIGWIDFEMKSKHSKDLIEGNDLKDGYKAGLLREHLSKNGGKGDKKDGESPTDSTKTGSEGKINLVGGITNIVLKNKQLTSQSGQVLLAKELAEELMKRDDFKNGKYSEEQVKGMFNGGKEDDLINELRNLKYFDSKKQ